MERERERKKEREREGVTEGRGEKEFYKKEVHGLHQRSSFVGTIVQAGVLVQHFFFSKFNLINVT